jgi:predicted adenine nucleotide alpha hydrolase (AANH) superfamily ATPase
MNVLLHTCCGPCTIHPLEVLRGEGLMVTGFFYRHNIHPYRECQRREETLQAYAQQQNLPLIVTPGYDLEGFVRNAVFRETERCRFCYHDRLQATALEARRGGFAAFSSTLLYSRHQQHDVLRGLRQAIARETGVEFLYRDFRPGWQAGIAASKALGMYRQPYCGCIYSEKDRYFRG